MWTFDNPYICLDYMKEDMYQAEYENMLLDIWYYWDWLKLKVIRNYDWELPLEVVTFHDVWLIESFIEIFKSRILWWYYPVKWDFEPNKWIE